MISMPLLPQIWNKISQIQPSWPILLSSDAGETGCHDCACPDQLLMLASSATDRALPHVRTSDVYTAPLPRGFHVVMSPSASAGPSILNRDGWERWQSFATAHVPADNFDVALAQQCLISPASSVPMPAPTPPVTLTAWMHVTNVCNLDCPYCYVRKSSEEMNEEVGTAAIQALFRTAQTCGFRRVKVNMPAAKPRCTCVSSASSRMWRWSLRRDRNRIQRGPPHEWPVFACS